MNLSSGHKIFTRTYTTSSKRWASAAGPSASAAPFHVFDRSAKVIQRNRAASNKEKSRLADYVRDQVAEDMIERLLDIKRRFPSIVDIGSGGGHLSKFLTPDITQKLIMTDSSEKMLFRDVDIPTTVPVERVVCDEELLPFEEDSVEAVMSCLSMHWVNDLPGTLIQIKRALKPDSPFIGAMLGGDTLFELRTSLQLAELEREGGISPRISPMTDSQMITHLMNRAGFTIPTVDVDEIEIRYPSILELIEDLKWMGENNVVLSRRKQLNYDVLLAAASIYKEMHGLEDGSIPATFQIMHMIGWKPGPDQPKPAKRGSGTVNLKDVLGEGNDKL